MAQRHAYSQPIETYSLAPHNRNIWPSPTPTANQYKHMAHRHAHSQPIETYGLAPHNRNIWPSPTPTANQYKHMAQHRIIETYGHTIARRRRRRHAWPILLSAFHPVVYPLLLCLDERCCRILLQAVVISRWRKCHSRGGISFSGRDLNRTEGSSFAERGPPSQGGSLFPKDGTSFSGRKYKYHSRGKRLSYERNLFLGEKTSSAKKERLSYGRNLIRRMEPLSQEEPQSRREK